MASDRDPMLDAILCAECPKEFVPKREGQTTCGTPSCSGGQGARKRVYGRKQIKTTTKRETK